MIIFPAIDIREGKVVRLIQGKFDQVTEYAQDPLIVAKEWVKKGAQWLHCVDLDGALHGEMKNIDVILNIAKEINIPIQVGGGIRDKKTIEKLIEGNIARVILGTKIVEDSSFLIDVLAKHQDKIAVSLDCSNGMVAQRGWTSTSDIKATNLAKELEILGVKYIIYTDIARDGMLTGPNYEGIKEMLSCTKIPIIASGGVSNLSDIIKLKEYTQDGLLGAITGKAIYEGKLDLEEAIKHAN